MWNAEHSINHAKTCQATNFVCGMLSIPTKTNVSRERRESRVESEKGEGVKSNRKRRVESGQPRVKRSERS